MKIKQNIMQFGASNFIPPIKKPIANTSINCSHMYQVPTYSACLKNLNFASIPLVEVLH